MSTGRGPADLARENVSIAGELLEQKNLSTAERAEIVRISDSSGSYGRPLPDDKIDAGIVEDNRKIKRLQFAIEERVAAAPTAAAGAAGDVKGAGGPVTSVFGVTGTAADDTKGVIPTATATGAAPAAAGTVALDSKGRPLPPAPTGSPAAAVTIAAGTAAPPIPTPPGVVPYAVGGAAAPAAPRGPTPPPGLPPWLVDRKGAGAGPAAAAAAGAGPVAGGSTVLSPPPAVGPGAGAGPVVAPVVPVAPPPLGGPVPAGGAGPAAAGAGAAAAGAGAAAGAAAAPAVFNPNDVKFVNTPPSDLTKLQKELKRIENQADKAQVATIKSSGKLGPPRNLTATERKAYDVSLTHEYRKGGAAKSNMARAVDKLKLTPDELKDATPDAKTATPAAIADFKTFEANLKGRLDLAYEHIENLCAGTPDPVTGTRGPDGAYAKLLEGKAPDMKAWDAKFDEHRKELKRIHFDCKDDKQKEVVQAKIKQLDAAQNAVNVEIKSLERSLASKRQNDFMDQYRRQFDLTGQWEWKLVATLRGGELPEDKKLAGGLIAGSDEDNRAISGRYSQSMLQDDTKSANHKEGLFIDKGFAGVKYIEFKVKGEPPDQEIAVSPSDVPDRARFDSDKDYLTSFSKTWGKCFDLRISKAPLKDDKITFDPPDANKPKAYPQDYSLTGACKARLYKQELMAALDLGKERKVPVDFPQEALDALKNAFPKGEGEKEYNEVLRAMEAQQRQARKDRGLPEEEKKEEAKAGARFEPGAEPPAPGPGPGPFGM